MVTINSKAGAEKALSCVSPEHVFYVCDGTVLRSLEELESYLQNVSIEVYSYHVTQDRNDFHNWVNDVIGDAKLAKDLAKAKNHGAAALLLKERVKWLRKKAK